MTLGQKCHSDSSVQKYTVYFLTVSSSSCDLEIRPVSISVVRSGIAQRAAVNKHGSLGRAGGGWGSVAQRERLSILVFRGA